MTRGADKRHNGKSRGGSFGEHFVGIPRSAYSSPLFVVLSPWAIKLLVDLGAQYNGRNNGDLAAAWKLMQPRGWNSETTLNKAKKQLLAAGFIMEMRKGRRPNVCSLFALTWRPLNPSPRHDFGPNGFEPYGYLKLAPPPLLVMSGARKKRGAYSSGCGMNFLIAPRRAVASGLLLHRVVLCGRSLAPVYCTLWSALYTCHLWGGRNDLTDDFVIRKG